MPELPEVETTVRDLRPKVVGRSFQGVEIEIPRMVRAPSPEALQHDLVGRKIRALERRGKYILFNLDRGTLVVHLMMGGALRWAKPTEDARARHTRLAFRLDDGSELWLVNPRTLGGVWLVDDPVLVIGKLGPEPLSQDFTAGYLAQRLQGRSAPTKPLLLSQEVVAGIGNIYADEALFLAAIRPERPADELAEEDISRLHGAIQTVLEKGIRLRGTSLGDFFDPFGGSGSHQTQLAVFRRQGQPCPRCGTAIQKKMFRGRGTHFCPHCQT